MNKRLSNCTRSLFLFLVLAVALLGTHGISNAEDMVKGSKDHTGTEQENASSFTKKNELKAATNAGAALRKSKGLGRTTTNDDRRAAAQRNAARKAAAAKAQGRQP